MISLEQKEKLLSLVKSEQAKQMINIICEKGYATSAEIKNGVKTSVIVPNISDIARKIKPFCDEAGVKLVNEKIKSKKQKNPLFRSGEMWGKANQAYRWEFISNKKS